VETRRIARVHPSTLYRDLAGEAVLLQLDTGEYFGLDEVGNRIWQLMMENGEIGSIAERMLSEYEVEPDALSHDLEELFEELASRQLIEIHRVSAPMKHP